MEITRHGHAIIEEDTHISQWVRKTGLIDHGQHIEKTFRRFFGEGDFVVDVGAFIGDHTVPYAQIVGPRGKVIAFEPNPAARECLLHNVQCYPWVEVRQAGLSDRSGMFYLTTNENAGASHLSPTRDPELQTQNAVFVWALDDAKLPRLDFLKIDVEGSEVDVLEGAKETIQRCRPAMLIESAVHQKRTGRTQNHIFQWLVDNLEGYSLSPDTHTGQPQYDIECMPEEQTFGNQPHL
jgi:FkbM family methyltransferase